MQVTKRMELNDTHHKVINEAEICISFSTSCSSNKTWMTATSYYKGWEITEEIDLGELFEKFEIDGYSTYPIKNYDEDYDDEYYDEEGGIYCYICGKDVEEIKQKEKKFTEEIERIKEEAIKRIEEQIKKIN